LADYGERYGEFRRSGIEVVAITPDGPKQARRMRTSLKLPFTVLSDANRDAARALGLLGREADAKNPTPATLVLDNQRRVRLSALNSAEKCLLARDTLEYARALKQESPSASMPTPQLEAPKPGILFLRAIANMAASFMGAR
jgi:peroxiredoxin